MAQQDKFKADIAYALAKTIDSVQDSETVIEKNRYYGCLLQRGEDKYKLTISIEKVENGDD